LLKLIAKLSELPSGLLSATLTLKMTPLPSSRRGRATQVGAVPIERERTNVRSCNGDTSRRVVERERAFRAAGVTTPKLVVNSDPIPPQSRATGDGIEQIVASIRSSRGRWFLGSNQRTRRPDVYGESSNIKGPTGCSFDSSCARDTVAAIDVRAGSNTARLHHCRFNV
jgi:hypothetical protein